MPPGHVSKENAQTEWINCVTVLISGEKTRTRDVFSTSHPDFWGDFPDSRRFCGLHPGIWGGTPDEQYTLAVFWAKSVQAVLKNDVKR